MDLKELRKRIDQVDVETLSLLNRRMELTVRVRKLRAEPSDPAREEEIIQSIRTASRGLIDPEFSERLYTEIITESRRLQGENFRLIGFQGEHVAYSEMAIRQFETQAVSIPHQEFSEVFDGVHSGVLDYGVVPVENSLAGNVSQVDDLLAVTDLHIVGEVILPVHHCLIALPDSDYHDIRVVYSHPQALAQCKGFIARNKLEPRPYYDTAGAAMMLARERPAASAVIASRLAADLYNLNILKENVEDNHSNATRFFVLSRKPLPEQGDKCSIVFATAHKPGALYCVLKAFSESEINLTRIESRPMPHTPGKYVFLLDFLGSDQEDRVKSALEMVRKESASLRVLGCYKKAQS